VQFFKDLSLSTATAGFVAVLVGFTSSIAIVFQAAQSFGATPDLMASWLWAIGLGMGVCCIVPSLWLRKPVMIAWSTPGAAVLASAGAAGAFTMQDAVGAFLMCAALTVLVGWTGWFERLMDRIPVALASALLAGVLARFGLAGFSAAHTALPLVLVMLITYLLGKRLLPRYAVPCTLLVSVIFVALGPGFAPVDVRLGLTWPVWVTPRFSLSALVSLALPLFIVTMASQNMPGVAAIRACGFGDERSRGGDAGIPISPIITLTGVVALLLAPFGAFALNFSAITAAICMGPEAHHEPRRRYTAAVACGVLYVVVAVLGSTIIAILTAFPKELVAAIAGLALLSTIAGALSAALKDESSRDAAIITFLVTLSGVVIGGVGSAFWGVAAGAVALLVQHYGANLKSAA
jgi:benzoate membrane transport protein